MNSMIKFLFLIVLLISSGCSSAQPQYAEKAISHEKWNALLVEHVSADGKVNYDGFMEDRATLKGYLDLLSNNHPHPEKWTEEERLAYWINAYNAFTVELILRHYPLESITDIKKLHIPLVNTPWHIKFFKIGGVEMNLDEIEHKILRKKFDEPRIHFAIVCASVSCPNLLNEAFTAEKLEQQLTAQAKSFVNDPTKNILAEDKVQLSKIFSWFKGDFTKNGSLIAYINQYADKPVSEKAKVKHLSYNWNLNN